MYCILVYGVSRNYGEHVMTDSYQLAIERREAMKAELELIERYLELHATLFGTQKSQRVFASLARDEEADVDQRNDPKAIAKVATDILASADRPMQRGKLIEAVQAAGIAIHSTDKNKYIGTVMWRNRDKFRNVDGQGYWPRDRALPPDIQAELIP